MFDLVRMVPCDIVVRVMDKPGFVGELTVELAPPMDDWRFDAMTRMEAEIVINKLMQEVFERDFKNTPLSNDTKRHFGHALQSKIKLLVDQGMFVGRRPIDSHVWKGSNERPDDPRK